MAKHSNVRTRVDLVSVVLGNTVGRSYNIARSNDVWTNSALVSLKANIDRLLIVKGIRNVL